MSDRYKHSDDRFDARPPELDELDVYLKQTGAEWRAVSTEIGTVTDHLRHHASQLTAEHISHAAEAEPAVAPRLRSVSAPTKLHKQHRSRRLSLRLASGLVAVLAVVAVVGALTALLLSASAGRTSLPPSGASPSQHGRWIALDKLDATVEFDANDMPAIAPSDPRVVYETMVYGIQQHQAGSLRRTDDGGATWHSLPLPIAAAHVGHAGILVSPRDPHNVFLYVISTNAADCPADRVQPLTESNVPGAVICELQYTSTDGGAHWVTTTMPGPEALTSGLKNYGATSLQAGVGGGQSYLYALLECVSTEPCSRVGASTDSGKTWHYADDQLFAAGAHNVCTVAADPRSSALFAVTTSTSCDSDAQKPLTLWRSDDAGGHWSKQGVLATPNVQGAQIAHAQGTDHALLYLALPRTAAITTDKEGDHYPTFSADPSDLKVSADGGKTWQSAPAAGIPVGLKPYYDGGLLGTLSDGSVVVDYIVQNHEENFEGSTLFAWKPGDASWRQIAPPVTWEADALLAVGGSKPGADTLYLSMVDRDGSGAAAHPTFSFLRFEP